VKNTAADNPRFTRPMLWLWERGLARAPAWVPGPVRGVARRLLLRTRDNDTHLQASLEPLPDGVAALLAEESGRLQAVLGLDEPLWASTRTDGKPAATRGSARSA
jgi:hypothetical protein